MRTKILRFFILLATMLSSWQAAQAVIDEIGGLETPSQATPAMQYALAQSTAQHSDTPIVALLATVPRSEQATLALNLFLAINDDVEARRRVGTIILLAPSSVGEINQKHVLLLTRAYLQTIQHPLQVLNQGVDTRVFDDQLFQWKTRQMLAAYLGAHQFPESRSPDVTPIDRLKRVFVEAENAHPNQSVAAKIQACKSLLTQ